MMIISNNSKVEMSLLKKQIKLESDEIQAFPDLQKILPKCNNYRVVEFTAGEEPESFTSIIRADIENKLQANSWLEAFTETSLLTFRVDRTHVENTSRLVFKKEFRCQHNTRPNSHRVKQPHAKHVNCNAKLTITVKQKAMLRSKDKYLKDYPCEILLRHNHNHPIREACILRHRSPTQAVRERFGKLYEKGHSPASALQLFKCDLQQRHGELYENIVIDRAQCPSARWCYGLYYGTVKNKCKGIKSAMNKEPLGETNDKSNGVLNVKDIAVRPRRCQRVFTEGWEQRVVEDFPIYILPDVTVSKAEVAMDNERLSNDIDTVPDEVCEVLVDTTQSSNVEGGLSVVFEDLLEKMRHNPDAMNPAVQSFVEQYKNCANNGNLINALTTFGSN